MTPFFSFLKNFVFQKTKKWCHARKDDDSIIVDIYSLTSLQNLIYF
ncbi:hypothetical protein L6261_03690 [Candidatus Parcubacteria bacterium]|nr:hypothetical protein [Candidatus Parcubacteria bacterium]